VLVLVLFASTLVKMLGRVAAGSLGHEVLFLLVGLELIKISGLLIPPAFFFAILWVLGRMYRDSEMAALEAAGVGTFRVYRSFLLSAVPLALIVTWLVMSVLPWAKSIEKQVKAEQASTAEITGVRPGRFNEFSRGELVVYTESASPDGGLRKVFLQHRKHGKLGLVTANRAYKYRDPETGAGFVVLVDGYRYEGLPGRGDFTIGEFGEYAVRLPQVEFDRRDLPSSARTWQELMRSDRNEDRAELHYRLSFPLAVLAFAVVSVPLARSLPRQGVYGRLSLAVLVYFSYMNLQRVAERWIEQGVTPGWLGMWWVPVSMAAVAALVILVDSTRFKVAWSRWRRS
jgi:lipopolysaccharide export system permease protein